MFLGRTGGRSFSPGGTACGSSASVVSRVSCKGSKAKKFKAEHEADILLHQAAKKYFDEQDLKKLPSVKSLQAEYAELLAKKKAAYADYREARNEMQELVTARANVERILGKSPEREARTGPEKEQR